MIIEVGNFSGDSKAIFEMGKKKFIETFSGLVNTDINQIWDKIEAIENQPESRSTKVESPKNKK